MKVKLVGGPADGAMIELKYPVEQFTLARSGPTPPLAGEGPLSAVYDRWYRSAERWVYRFHDDRGPTTSRARNDPQDKGA
jgi:hypothetical protein